VADPLARTPAPGLALRVLVAWVLDQLAAALAMRLREADARERDPDWGMVSQKTVPAWIHPDAYVEACRDGKIEGARVWRRQWIAPREAVERWWLAESREPAPANDVADPESVEAILAANGLAPTSRKG
jgi:hypothetical protein